MESGNDPNVYNTLGCPGAQDEWTCCQSIGKAACGAALEQRYGSFVTTADIDFLKSYGINTLRVPTTYAAWTDVPGSQLYHGSQQARTVTNYAVSKGMHVILGLHSFPGGCERVLVPRVSLLLISVCKANALDIGEALGHAGWWYNTTRFSQTLDAIDSMIS